jgi:WD40 repeat protein
MKKILLSLIILLTSIPLLHAQDEFSVNHPELEWSSYETEHFFVHFHQGTKRTALLTGKIAEDIYPAVTKLYNYEPKGKIHFIIKDTDDYSNGGAFFFDDKIEIWAPNLDYVMRGTKNWLRDVIAHEFTHMISIQATLKSSTTVPYGFIQVFGYEPERRNDVVRGFPNTVVSYPVASINVPVWFAEGVAQHQAPNARFDYRDPNREMVLRDRVIHDALLTFPEMDVFGKTSHGNESAYNLGFAFVNYLTERFGEGWLQRISEANSKWKTVTFHSALQQATGVDADSLYLQWKQHLEKTYDEKLATIRAHEQSGTAVERQGFANLYPVWSPDGKKIAYTSNRGNDYFGQNYLVVYNRETKTRKKLAGRIHTSIDWSPDGRYLVYMRATENELTGSHYNDLCLYDLQEDEEIRLSRALRGKNPDFSPDGKKIAFAAETNGLNQLFILDWDGALEIDEDRVYHVDIETGALQDAASGSTREVTVAGSGLKEVLNFSNGRQIYHPRWSPAGDKIVFDTAVEYGRDIAQLDLGSGEVTFLLHGREEERYPVYHPEKPWLYYTSGETGIYNIYRLDLESGEKLLLTNVTGGAVMPDVNRNSEVVFACYDSIGYKIHTIANTGAVAPENAVYQQDYIASIPKKNFDDDQLIDPVISPYKQRFTGLHILPRLLFDYGTIKPGFYLFSSDVLDKMTLIAGADINSDLDYDLFGLFEYRVINPTLFIEAYNSTANIKDTLRIRQGENNYLRLNRDVNFDLTEVRAGAAFKYPASLDLNWRLSYVMSLYNAQLEWLDPLYNENFVFRYNYLKGHAVELTMNTDQRKLDRHRDINPSGGRQVFMRYRYESNDFLIDFDTGQTIGLERYRTYRFNSIELDWEEYFHNPLFENHTLALRLRGAYLDKNDVDDFFHLYAGGLIGMKGYSYFSFGGTRKLVSTLTYRFPLWNDIGMQFLNIHFNKLYFGFFADYGNAWVGDNPDWGEFKRDIGMQLRLETFSNYLFPTRFFFEAAYPLDEVVNSTVTYSRDWRYYFGLLFEFDLRERGRQPFRLNR